MVDDSGYEKAYTLMGVWVRLQLVIMLISLIWISASFTTLSTFSRIAEVSGLRTGETGNVTEDLLVADWKRNNKIIRYSTFLNNNIFDRFVCLLH